ncbi:MULTISPECIES: 5-formyltetrahydrofolate cyclo-ligase [unclassified Synechocystis]|uniref:5-formyltetrahydrofolate cyclo-ligase n=1 Tax=unclassified Synechocystis TaxID=2640012 RepID=UPI0003F6A45F|nr:MULTISPECIES: 5-formyltetrahydrofolate cyclo-ligase [unclassified Synechocystis]AIE73133.1 5-formyltetrahydrofolate cyclo-ligase [Synechocystis sp. PCC 6714]MCT0254346.1 5-formyltetrahydrofolate cyclo-ligase [Synechocystis sp. CS-94]
MDKIHLRQTLLQQRRQWSRFQWQQQSIELCAQLQQWSVFQQAKLVCAYFSTQREPDLQSLFERLGQTKLWGFPRCVQKNLVWHPWQWGQPLTTGSYGIKVPAAQTEILSPMEVDLLLVPCLGGDRQGYRLGYGGGYYDRLFIDPLWRAVPKAGLLFEVGLKEKLPRDSWDIPLPTLITEKQIIVISNNFETT